MKKIVMMWFPLLLLVACNPKKDTKALVNRSGNSSGSVGDLSNGCTAESKIGTVYDSTVNASLFESRVKALLSASVLPSQVGQISAEANGTTGVRFSGVIKLDQDGQVIEASSNLQMKIYDSFAVSGHLTEGVLDQPIEIHFIPTQGAKIQGRFNLATGVGSITFNDTYGEVSFVNAQLDGKSLQGTVQFKNKTNIDGGAAAAGILGQFYVARCGIIQ